MDLKEIFKDALAGHGKYGVVGHNIAYTLSPAMHAAALAHFRIPAVYRKIDITPEEWSTFEVQAKALPLDGFNITKPFKEKAFKSFGEGHDGAAWDFISAVNTARCGANRVNWAVANTDVLGFWADFQANGVSVDGKKVLLLGAGGAARAVLGAFRLQRAKPSRILILNRHAEKVQPMIDDMRAHGAVGFQGIPLGVVAPSRLRIAVESAEIVINATTVGERSEGNLSPIRVDWLRPEVVVYDLISHRPTRLMEAARKIGRGFGGLGMLVNQGALAFEFWFGDELKKVKYDATELRETMRDAAEKALRERL